MYFSQFINFPKKKPFPERSWLLILVHSVFYFINICSVNLFIKGGTNERF